MERKAKIDKVKLKTSYDVAVALAHDLRLSILKCIHEKGVTNVRGIYTALDLQQSLTSQQLKILKDTALVIRTRKGKEIYYSVNYERLAALSNTLQQFFEK